MEAVDADVTEQDGLMTGRAAAATGRGIGNERKSGETGVVRVRVGVCVTV